MTADDSHSSGCVAFCRPTTTSSMTSPRPADMMILSWRISKCSKKHPSCGPSNHWITGSLAHKLANSPTKYFALTLAHARTVTNSHFRKKVCVSKALTKKTRICVLRKCTGANFSHDAHGLLASENLGNSLNDLQSWITHSLNRSSYHSLSAPNCTNKARSCAQSIKFQELRRLQTESLNFSLCPFSTQSHICSLNDASLAIAH